MAAKMTAAGKAKIKELEKKIEKRDFVLENLVRAVDANDKTASDQWASNARELLGLEYDPGPGRG